MGFAIQSPSIEDRMQHESLPDEHIEGPEDYVAVFKGGPNHGVVLRGDSPMAGTWHTAMGEGLLPDIGARFQTASIADLIGMREVDRSRYFAALAKIGITEKRMAIYQVESIADGVIVYAYQGDA